MTLELSQHGHHCSITPSTRDGCLPTLDLLVLAPRGPSLSIRSSTPQLIGHSDSVLRARRSSWPTDRRGSMSPPERDFSTPAKDNPFEELNPKGSRKRKQVDFTCNKIQEGIHLQQVTASPTLKKSKDMPACRSPTITARPTANANQGLPMETDAGSVPGVRTIHNPLAPPVIPTPPPCGLDQFRRGHGTDRPQFPE